MFFVHVITLKVLKLAVYHFEALLLAVLRQNKVFIKIILIYTNYTNVIFSNLAIKLFKNTNIDKYNIKLIKGKQPLYGPIYNLAMIKLEILKV